MADPVITLADQAASLETLLLACGVPAAVAGQAAWSVAYRVIYEQPVFGAVMGRSAPATLEALADWQRQQRPV